ncbi:MAG: DUF1491 family protein [Pseudomonadota bacterium]
MAIRLKTEFRAAAHVRRAEAGGAFAAIVRRGDPDAGSLIVKVFFAGGGFGASNMAGGPDGSNSADGAGPRAQVFLEGRALDGAPTWRDPLSGPADEATVDAWLAKEIDFDPDLWIIEIEDKEGRAFLE